MQGMWTAEDVLRKASLLEPKVSLLRVEAAEIAEKANLEQANHGFPDVEGLIWAAI